MLGATFNLIKCVFSHRNVFQNGINTLSKMVNHFCQKAQNFVHVEPYDFVQISPAYGPNTYQIMYGKTLDFQCQYQQLLYKIPDQKISNNQKLKITVNLPSKLFPTAVANADIGNLK